uniref:Uncharacterized protein n=1 Tax=Molossus molossus TaxID=27622 RepID=A0A7J8CZ11_MOLMO|nr:hypothetical protein HJG59_009442 [Molossus molossus]
MMSEVIWCPVPPTPNHLSLSQTRFSQFPQPGSASICLPQIPAVNPAGLPLRMCMPSPPVASPYSFSIDSRGCWGDSMSQHRPSAQSRAWAVFAFRVLVIITIFAWRMYSLSLPLSGRAPGEGVAARAGRLGVRARAMAEETCGEAPGNASCLGSPCVLRARFTVCRTLRGIHTESSLKAGT